MFYSVLFSFLPEPSKVVFLSKNFFWTTYARFYLSIKEGTISHHKRKLCELDPVFKSNEASQELIRRRKVALEQGIDPLSSDYPDVLDENNPKSREE